MESRTKGFVFVFATAMISGVSIFANKFGVSGFDPFVFASLKNLVVALLLLSGVAFFTRFRELRKLGRSQWKRMVTIGVLGGSVPFLLFFVKVLFDMDYHHQN